MSKKYELPVRVYWEDTDAGGIVYHANYICFMERGRSELLRSLAISQESMRTENVPCFVVTHISIDYKRPARLDDLLVVETWISNLRRASVVFEQVIRRGDELIAKASVKCATVDVNTLSPAQMPEFLRERLIEMIPEQ